MIPAPPVAQDKGRQQFRNAGQPVIILNAGCIVMPVSKEIDIRALFARRKPAVFQHARGGTVVQHGKAVHRAQAVIERTGPVDLVERGRCALQILQSLLSPVPGKRRIRNTFNGDAVLQGLPFFQGHLQHVRPDHRPVVLDLCPDGAFAQITCSDGERGIVCPCTLLKADQARGDHGHTDLAAHDRLIRPGMRMRLHAKIGGKLLIHIVDSFLHRSIPVLFTCTRYDYYTRSA